ncbi:DUF2480 family protein [Sphingobacterium suaedae]|uniref:DUF2480 family protein n=1 Tax=Sphingobacterium suaedae TaxID=1686402 RepID=A0ABW5KJD1_9SPHI
MGEWYNKVEATGIITYDPRDLQPKEASVFIDIKDFLFMGMIIRERELKHAIAG